MKKILIIEKQSSTRRLLLELLRSAGAKLVAVDDEAGALRQLKNESFDLIFSDLHGMRAAHKRKKGASLIFLPANDHEVYSSADAILPRPFDLSAIQKLLGQFNAKKDKRIIISASPEMAKILKHVERIARSHSNTFIYGESGTGKEVIAGLIHQKSKRSQKPFIRVNCAALPETLIESEFFGHEKGSFTGAHSKRIGRFELADQGTLLLDEISEIPLSLQVKLLRVVQEQEFERVGGVNPIHVDVRLISTSNRKMREAISQGEFREDLYYRLNVIPIFLPPLRERKEDILPLTEFFIKQVCEKNHLALKTFTKKAEEKLLRYSWPGNIRELRNVIEHSIVMDFSEEIEENHLFLEPLFIETGSSSIPSFSSKKGLTLKEVEKEHILETLKRHQYNRTNTAKELGVSTRTLRNKLNLYRSE